MSSFVDQWADDWRGVQPVVDSYPKKVRDRVLGPFFSEFQDFVVSRTPEEVVDSVRDYAKRAELRIGDVSDRPYFVTNEDMGISGAGNDAFALVRPGSRDGPITIAFAHTDSPHLVATTAPVFCQGDCEAVEVTPTLQIMTRPYGGIGVDDWKNVGNVDVIGSMYLGNEKHIVDLTGVVQPVSFHVNDREETKFEVLRVDVQGSRTLDEIYKKFKIRDSMNFGSARVRIVPSYNKDNIRLNGNSVTAYGLDDKMGIFSIVKAFMDSYQSRKCQNTMMIFGTDNEEILGGGGSAGYSGFVESVIHETLRGTKGNSLYRELVLPLDLRKGLMGGWPAVVVDTDVALGPAELLKFIKDGMINIYDGPKVGYGLCIQADPTGEQYAYSPKHGAMFEKMLMDKHRGSVKKRRSRFQYTGDAVTPEFSDEFGGGLMAAYFQDEMPVLAVACPVTSLHTPAETMNMFDMFSLYQGIKMYLQHGK